jgi:hypothetical protein
MAEESPVNNKLQWERMIHAELGQLQNKKLVMKPADTIPLTKK